MYTVFLKTCSIFLVILFGYIVRRRGLIDAPFNRRLALLLMNVFYPALIYSAIVRQFSLGAILENWALPAGSALIMGLGWLTGLAVRPALRRVPEPTARMFHFLCTMNNYSFLPIMLASMFWGEKGVAMVVFSTLGAEVMVWTFGIQAITGHRAGLRSLKHLCSMPMLAMLAAFGTLILRAILDQTGVSSVIASSPAMPLLAMGLDTLTMTGAATIPVSAIIAGARMAGLHPRHLFSPLMGAMTVLRLLAIPAMAVLLLYLLPLTQTIREILTVVAVMPCALASVTIAEVYDGDGEFAAAGVLITHLVCLGTIPVWLRIAGVGA